MSNFLKGLFLSLAPSPLLMLAKKRHYVSSLKNFNYSDEPDLVIADLLVSKGDSVIDIGANIGWYTKALSEKVGIEGHIYSIEPIPPTFNILNYCVEKLNLGNVTTYNLALSDKQGSAVMEIPRYDDELGDNFYMAKLVDTTNQDDQVTSFNVKIDTLDKLVHNNSVENISFIKCDVEGHELSVISGSMNLLSNVPAAWLIEVSSDPQDTESDAYKIFELFRKNHYAPYWYDHANNTLVAYKLGDNSVNYFFLRQAHCEKLQQRNQAFS